MNPLHIHSTIRMYYNVQPHITISLFHHLKLCKRHRKDDLATCYFFYFNTFLLKKAFNKFSL